MHITHQLTPQSLCAVFITNVTIQVINTQLISNVRTDERILEYDIDSVVFEQRSPFQKVQIVHSKSLGNILVLDELQSMLGVFDVRTCACRISLQRFFGVVPMH